MIIMAENGRMRTAKVSFVLVLCAVFMLLVWPGAAEGTESQVAKLQTGTMTVNIKNETAPVPAQGLCPCLSGREF